MKHSLNVTIFLVILFLISQGVGLIVVNAYIDQEVTQATGNVTFSELPYDIERPPVEENNSYWYILLGVAMGTALMLLLIKFRKVGLWKIWFFAAVWICLSIAFSAFVHQIIAAIFALGLTILKVVRKNIIAHNISEAFVYAGLAAIFVPIMNMFSAFMILVLISAYDFIAVWRTKHMVTLAQFQTKTKIFAGLMIPYKTKQGKVKKVKKESRTAILGGGDIAFPLLFSGVVLKTLGMTQAAIVSVVCALGLAVLLTKAEKGKFYPAMPMLSAACFLGFVIAYLLV